ncbi:transposase IS200 family protein [Algoriphagus ratkowskyi]|uniref:Transposase n=1 Tax=Algoriphagus ratkowskyi TaxID=57028 RepID=A0A2W7R1I6_9BACT|nr:transposase [Algoriphagus ratkowskyi]PZX52100.1 transposase IS200 family protein [Algoriphagus ratkowskyi]TXD76134.1 transposase [Algoriphagus ratkowskyi]
MELNTLYFFTGTIHKWIPLLDKNGFKEIILSSLSYLFEQKCMKIYGFVIMPNHIHLIIENIKMNGKELPHASFLKYTSHSFLKRLKNESPELLSKFRVELINKTYQFWQRDSLAIELYTPEVVYQKLDYVHNNPCQKKWMLAEDPVKYPYSSFNFYELNTDDFGFLTHIGERL